MTAEIERQVQQRLAERLSAAGVHEAEVGLEVLYLLPVDFTRSYSALYHKALKTAGAQAASGSEDRGRADERTGSALGRTRAGGARASSLSEGKTLGQMRGATVGRRHRQSWVIGDERAFGRKQRIDRKLRALAREIKASMAELDSGDDGKAGGDAGSAVTEGHRCTGKGCRKFLEKGFEYCPWCGTRQRATRRSGRDESDRSKKAK